MEMPADDGTVQRWPAIVEGWTEQRDGVTYLVPQAPQPFVEGWPSGWPMSDGAGWVELHGEQPKMLGYEERTARPPTERLRTGAPAYEPLVAHVYQALRRMHEKNAPALPEAVNLARDPYNYEIPWGIYSARLREAGLLSPNGTLPPAVGEIILASVEHDGGELKVVDPIQRQHAAGS